MAPRERQLPGTRPTERTQTVDKKSLLQNTLTDETKHTILREAVDRFNHELVADEERQLLLDRIKRIRRQLRLA